MRDAFTPLRVGSWVGACALLGVGVGCPRALDSERRPAPVAAELEAPSVAAPEQPRAERTLIEVLLPDGQRTASLEPAENGYALIDRAGWTIGRVRVQPRLVEVRGRSGEILCVARATTGGFRLDDGGEALRMTGTEDSDGVVITNKGELVGRLAGGALLTPGGVLRAVPVGEYVEVSFDGDRVLALRGFDHESAAWLAYTPLSFPERIAMMFLQAELL